MAMKVLNNCLECVIGYKKRLSSRTGTGGEPLLYEGGDALESKSGRFFGVVNSFPIVIFPLQECQGKRVVLENKKGDSRMAIP